MIEKTTMFSQLAVALLVRILVEGERGWLFTPTQTSTDEEQFLSWLSSGMLRRVV
jgi:hypothetical protein